jgi:hypothetical protein
LVPLRNPSLTVGAPIRATTVREWFSAKAQYYTVEELGDWKIAKNETARARYRLLIYTGTLNHAPIENNWKAESWE